MKPWPTCSPLRFVLFWAGSSKQVKTLGEWRSCLTSPQAGLPSSCPHLLPSDLRAVGAEQPEVASDQYPPGEAAPGPCCGPAGNGATVHHSQPSLTRGSCRVLLTAGNENPGCIPWGVLCEHLWGPRLARGAEGIFYSMNRYPGDSGCQALFFMWWVVATPGSPASLSGFALPPWAKTNRRRWHDPHGLVSAAGVSPAMPLPSARYHQVLHQNLPYANLLN